MLLPRSWDYLSVIPIPDCRVHIINPSPFQKHDDDQHRNFVSASLSKPRIVLFEFYISARSLLRLVHIKPTDIGERGLYGAFDILDNAYELILGCDHDYEDSGGGLSFVAL